uniref:ATPase n=1 Tax=uncultured bacterium contig00037 TaxID=1181525 RepID=A0A806KAY0_9BACT|nr:ATPase [uncultured bacterium contig00037]
MKDLQPIAEFAQRVRSNIEKVFLGKTAVVDTLITAFLARGHVLLEDVPGTGKTILARAFASSLSLSFSRIQCTPDLLPADIIGVSIWRQDEDASGKKGRFVYRPGPIVKQFVLVDEINRATPRTQSALLEAMAEDQITVDGNRLAMPDPFFVLATENPVEFEGTFPLPEAQKDRFLLSFGIGYPDAESEAQMLENQRRITHPVTDLKPVATAEEVAPLQEAVSHIHVDKVVKDYLLALVEATRNNTQLRIGISPRGSLALYRTAQAMAAVRNRNFVTPEDIKEVAKSVFRQRLLLTSEAIVRGIEPDRIVQSILDTVPIPEYRTSA